ncbi:hypothetical protein DEW08_24690 (plasmid) [Azospirillum thermophilum]|uniref:Penicillin-binding protein activator LpoB n=2 Tax=Azospirillum thermophilum TaxID=2202148 RepID=A0A2S2CYF3_9PROT|nr:hypothetical protein DEW08_24690 [Azospirillum thermophilum]
MRKTAGGTVRGLALAAVLGATLAGCSYGRVNSRDYAQPTAAQALPAGSTIAVLPFENLTNHANAGLVAGDLVSTELYTLGLFRVSEASRVRNHLASAKLDAEKLSDGATAQEIGRALGVDAVLVGSVSEYGYQHGLREEPVVGLNARIVSTRDGAVLWASSQSEAGRGYFSRDSVNNVAQRVVTRMLSGLKDGFSPAVSESARPAAGG